MIDFEHDIKECVKTLSNGGIILYPTDTIWGLGCDAMDENAIKKLFDLKQRPQNKSFIVLLADGRDVLEYVAAPPPDIIAMLEEFNIPTTVIYEGALGFPELLTGEDGSIAIRVTNDPFCKALIKRLQKPLVSTSANISGTPSASTFKQISPAIKLGADYIVQYRQDDNTIKPASRVIRLSDEGEVIVLRP